MDMTTTWSNFTGWSRRSHPPLYGPNGSQWCVENIGGMGVFILDHLSLFLVYVHHGSLILYPDHWSRSSTIHYNSSVIASLYTDSWMLLASIQYTYINCILFYMINISYIYIYTLTFYSTGLLTVQHWRCEGAQTSSNHDYFLSETDPKLWHPSCFAVPRPSHVVLLSVSVYVKTSTISGLHWYHW